MFKVYTKDAAQVVADENTTTTDKIVDVLTAPISFSDTELVSKSNRAVSVLSWSALALLGGELLGQHRAAGGKQAFIPFFRPEPSL